MLRVCPHVGVASIHTLATQLHDVPSRINVIVTQQNIGMWGWLDGCQAQEEATVIRTGEIALIGICSICVSFITVFKILQKI